MGTSADPGASGSGGTDSGQGAGTQAGKPAAGASAGGASGGTGADGQSGAGTGAGSLDRSKLSEPLRNLSEDQLNSVVDTMFQALSRRETAPAGTAAPAPVVAEPEPDYNSMFDPASDKFNPKAAVAKLVEQNYGGLVRDISTRAVQGAYGRFREEFPDFKDFEGDISRTLKESGVVNPTDAQIQGVYFAAKGLKQSLRERQDRTKAQNAPPPSASVGSRGEEITADEPLDNDEKTVARRLFPNSPDPEKSYRDYAKRIENQDTTMKVPMGGGVKR